MMKRKISLTAVMMTMIIGLFYTFVFCMVGDISDTSELTSATVSENEIYSDIPADSTVTYALTFPTEETTKTTTARTELEGGLIDGTHNAFHAGVAKESTSKDFLATAETSAKPVTTTTLHTTTVPVTTTKPATTTTVPVTTTKPVTTTTVPVTTTKLATTTTVPVTTTKPVTTTTVPVTTTKSATTTTVPVTTTKPATTTTVPVTTTKPVTTTTVPVTTTATTTTTAATIDNSDTISYKINGKKYTDSAYTVVCRMVQKEMGSSFSEEALKAQAVASYSYMKYFNNRGTSPEVVISSESAVSSKVKSAVAEVIGQAVYRDGEICQTVYCASSGGYTANAQDVWGGYVPYLVSVEGEYDQYDRNYGVVVTFSEDAVRSKLESYIGQSLSDNPSEWIQILNTVDGGYIGDVSIDGKKTVSGRTVREKIFGFGLRSSKFDVEYNNGVFTFTTYGYGHGVGMSQNGANLYATKGGYTYVDILEHYYSGVEVR